MLDRLALRLATGALLALLFASQALASPAAPGAATLEVTPTTARIGDALAARLVLELPAGARIDPPALQTRFGPFSVLSGNWTGPEPAGELSRWTWNGTLAAYETGSLEIPAVAIEVPGAGGAATLRTEPITVAIESILPLEAAGESSSSADLADLKNPATVAPDYGALRKAAYLLAALLAAAAVAWWLHRRYAAKLAAVPVPEDPFRRVAPHQWAYEELQRLLERKLPEAGEVELFFSELARILKRYLGGRYRMDLMEQTTEDVGPLLAQAGAPASAVSDVRAFLTRCDLVKFAKAPVDAGACRSALDETYRLVDRTKPAEATAATQAGAA